MTDPTPQKRALPARERRESAVKRRLSSPAVQPSPTNKSAPTAAEPRQKRKYTRRATLVKPHDSTSNASTPAPAEDSLPTRLTSKPLPVLPEKQDEKLSSREYQSIADSAILAASLHRSRMQWLCEGIFKRYWVKPTKRKGVIEQPPDNPDIKSMQKLGNATITIEPHSFDATFYTVRDLTSVPPPYQRHPNQHTAKQPHTAFTPGGRSPSAAVNAPASPQVPTAPVTQQESSTPARPTPVPTQQTPQPMPPPAAGPPASSKPSDDPVIQMLAARAATDQRLKELMKIVAMSRATPEQLREFQGHIDEFNAVIKAREAKKTGGEQTKSGPSSAKSPPTQAPAPSPASHRSSSHGTARPMPVGPKQPYMAYYPPPPRPEPIIKHIIVEFQSPVSATQGPVTDRWLFPEHAVLEMRAGGMEMVASFFAERTGEAILQSLGPGEEGDDVFRSKYQAELEYFQPVTMVIKATQHRTIETIARAAKPLVDVQSHMKEVMAKKNRAPVEYLVHQLPRDRVASDPIGGDFVDSGVDISEQEDDELKEYYGV